MTMTDRIRSWRRARAVRAELVRLDDRTLHDLGIPRWRIAEISRGASVEPRLVT